MEANQPSSRSFRCIPLWKCDLSRLLKIMLMLCGTPLSSYIPLDLLLLLLLDFLHFPPLSSPSHPSFNLKTVFGLSRIHKIQLSFSFLPPSLLPPHEETRSRLDSSFPLARSIMIRLTDTRAACFRNTKAPRI